MRMEQGVWANPRGKERGEHANERAGTPRIQAVLVRMGAVGGGIACFAQVLVVLAGLDFGPSLEYGAQPAETR